VMSYFSVQFSPMVTNAYILKFFTCLYAMRWTPANNLTVLFAKDAANGENKGKWCWTSLQGIQLATVVKGSLKHMWVNRIGTSLIAPRWIHQVKWVQVPRSHHWCLTRIWQHSYSWTTKWKGGWELFALAKIWDSWWNECQSAITQ
jgi:hypothetical protein